MGGVVDSISNAIGDVGQAIGNIEHSVVHAVEGAAQSVGHALESVGKAVTNDPIGTLAKVAAVVTQQYWALPLISAADVVAHGGNLEQAAIAGGVSYLGGVVAAGVSDALTTSAESTLTSVQQGADGSTVYNYSDGSTMTQGADGSTSFTNPTGLSAGAAQAIGSGAANAAKALATTGDVSKAITAGVVSGAGGYLGSEASSALQDQGLSAGAANVLGKIGATTAVSAAAGKDPTQALASSLFSTAMGQTGSVLKSAWDGVNTAATNYNTQLDQTKALYTNELTPAQQAAMDAQTTAKASYDNYTTLNNQFNDLSSQYDAAKAAGNTDLANSLADQANALIPKLNAATDQFNTDAATYQTAMDKFNGINDKYTQQVNNLDSLKTDYSTKNDQLTQLAKDTQDAAQKVASMSDAAQQTFTNLTGSGSDVKAALDYATNVNGLSSTQQSAYSNALKAGLTVDQAYNAAPVAGNMDSAAQGVYYNALQSGDNADVAANKALLATVLTSGQGITPEQTPSGTPKTVDNASVTVTGISDAELAKQGIIPPNQAASTDQAPAADQTSSTDQAPAADQTSSTQPPAADQATSMVPSDSSGLSAGQLQMLVNSLMGGSGSAPRSASVATPSTPGISTTSSGISSVPGAVSPLAALGGTSSAASPSGTQGITDLKGQYTQGTPVKLWNEPTFAYTAPTQQTQPQQDNWQQIQQEILNAAAGGSIGHYEDGGSTGPSYILRGSYTKGTPVSAPLQFHGAQLPGYHERQFAAGGDVIPEGHNPTFFSEGGLNTLENTYVQGAGDGTSDSVAAMLANGEFVIPADVVSKLGNGSNEAGASVLDQFLVSIREHAQSNPPNELPPKSKGPLAYLLDAKRKA